VRPAHLRQAVGQARVHPSREPCTRHVQIIRSSSR
jgi:hypothetical protein